MPRRVCRESIGQEGGKSVVTFLMVYRWIGNMQTSDIRYIVKSCADTLLTVV